MNFKILCLLASCLFFSTADSQFIDVQRTIDERIIFLCNSTLSSKDDDISYKWYNENDKLIKSDLQYEVEKNKLILRKLHTNSPHYYKCVIELRSIGAKFAVTKKIESDVVSKLYRNKRHKNEALKFTTNMMPNKNFELGSTGKIHCKASGSKSIFWKRNNDEELPKDVVDVNGTLVFNSVEISMKGIYTCIATNGHEQITHQIEVRILPAFEIVPPDKMIVNEQEPIILHCLASGSPNPTIKWDFGTKMISSNGRFQIYDNGSLFIQEAHLDDSGRYGCTIGNSAGFKRSETFLTVKQADTQKLDNDEEADESNNLFSNKAVLITCSLAILYIICVVVLMIWCRQKRGMKRQSETDPENLKLNEDNNDTHEEKPKHKALVKSLSSSFTFDIRHEKITDIKKMGIDSNFKMEILIGFLSDSDLPSKVITKDNAVTDEIRMQQQTKVLIRTIRRDQDERDLAEFRRQVDLYCNVDSENVVKLFGLSKESKIYGMIIEHHDDLKAYLNEKDIAIIELLKYCHQLANAINAIHEKAKLTHRDISLINCIITKENVVKLTSKASTDNSEYYECNGHALPIRHSAPEIISSCKSKGEITYSFASDIYASGITFWEIFNKGNQPFKSLSKDDVFKKLQTKSLDYNSLMASIPPDLSEILLRCLKTEACDRLDSNDLLNCLEEAIARNN